MSAVSDWLAQTLITVGYSAAAGMLATALGLLWTTRRR